MAQDKETLYCVPGNHKWQRVRTRGRKPTNCPKHIPVTAPKVTTSEDDILHCEIGNHDWTRPSQRGRKPANCPTHKPAVQSNSRVTSEPNGMHILHCELGNHDWERAPTRGRKPVNCPTHKPAVIAGTNPRPPSEGLSSLRTLHCEIGNHDWLREAKRGRAPLNCPEHGATPPRAVPVRIVSDAFPIAEVPDEELPLVEVEGEYESETSEAEQRELLTAAFNPSPAKRGRPRIHATPEEAAEAALIKSRERATNLENALKERGTHLSQQGAHKLYKLVNGVANTDSAEYNFVRDFQPLAAAQFRNDQAARFDTGVYYFEKDGERED